MSPVEIMFALQQTPPFDSLTDSELEIAATVAVELRFAAGALVLGPGEPFHRLLIKLEGSWQLNDQELPGLLGIESLLAGAEGPGEIRAGAAGARCLTFTRGHFFTLINECPTLLLSLLSSADQVKEERGFL
tara:strand:- start:2800 stop:3195 length:396 start_codon:yes stop_codon:yes gene_type:complete